MSTNTIAISDFAQLLTEGGDKRISLAENGRNKYGYGVTPDPESLPFGSATASTISIIAYQEAEERYQKILAAEQNAGAYQAYAAAIEEVRQELKCLCDLALPAGDERYIADVSGTDIVFAASGTDLHLIAAQLMASQSNTNGKKAPKAQDEPEAAALIIMVEPAETGSAVPDALSGKHFSQFSALGIQVNSGQQIDGAFPVELRTVSIRHIDGTARELTHVDAEIEVLVKHAIAKCQRVMLILTDVTKTGMLGPSIGLAVQLQREYPDHLSVMVDACQFRISNVSLHGYLRLGFMVAVTGSKFIGGPSFSGALFIPPCLRNKLRQLPLSPALGAYSSRADWPHDWTGADNLNRKANYGLLLRWVAALSELRAFRAVPEPVICKFLFQFCDGIQAYFQQQSHLVLLPVIWPDRVILNTALSWDRFPSIFSFLLKDSSGCLLNQSQTLHVYRQLQQQDRRIQLGQPVMIGRNQQPPVSALRLCLSARLIVAATAGNGENAQKIIADALFALDTAAKLSAIPEI
ncbi:hypothetical protein [Undibacterium sp. Xuan67W]|uniref:hypothetical protein n=1 Tax=Undibacterium sp. Xuan67W TaxID=3413057 RepID=UPI003BF2B8DE